MKNNIKSLDVFKVHEDNSSGSGYRRFSYNYILFGVYCSPFWNCQNFSIGSFESIIDSVEQSDIYNLCKLLGNGRQLLMIDVNRLYAEKVRTIFKNAVNCIIDHPYKSSNGSHMNLFYIQLY